LRSAVSALGIIGGMFGAIFALVAVFVGGAGAAFGAERDGGLITLLGFVAVFLAIGGMVGGILAKSNRTASIVLLLVSGVLGFVCIGAWWILPGILLIVAGVLEMADRPVA
jgi:hypothetical protein